MKLQRNNKHSGRIVVGISAILISTTILSACGKFSVNSLDDVVPTENIEVVETPILKSVETSNQIIEESAENKAKEDIIEILPTDIPVEENNNEDTNIKKVTFKRLTPEEEALEREKYEIPQNADEVYPAYYYFCAGFYVDENPKLIFGYVDKVKDEEDKFVFIDLCTNEVLFEYKAPIPERYPLTWTGYNNESVEFNAIHPYFANNNIRLRFVDDVIISYNFMDEYSEEDFDHSVIEYFWELFPKMPDGRLYPATPDEYLTAYLNWVPESLRVTTDELNKAKDEPVKK